MSDTTNTNIDYLATLPLELIERMFICLDINTVLSVKSQVSMVGKDNGKYDKVMTACNDRLSELRYLDDIFGHGNGVKVLIAMAKSQAYISGSMAAEFHCPGTATSTSDCDFFINRNVKQVYRFMNDLAEIGITWWTNTEVFTKSLKRSGDEVTISAILFQQLMNDGVIESKMADLGFTMNDIAQVGEQDNPYCSITVGDTGLTVEYNDRPNTYVSSGDEFHIIQGELVKGREHTPIQLIVERRSPLNGCDVPAMMKFHSSGTQSFIGPCSTGHMYSNLTSENKMYGWSSIAKRTDKLPIPSTAFTVDTTNVKQWNKFESRGFEYISTDGDAYHCRVRHMQDGDASYMEYPNDIGIPYFVKEFYMEYSKNIAWFETSTGVIKINAPIAAIRAQQQFDVEGWLHGDDISHATCIQYLARYMPNQALLRDTVTNLAHLTFVGDDDSSVTDEE